MSKGCILVTGGAGYVGSHSAKCLSEAGYDVVVYDNLQSGHRAFVRWGPFEHGDIRDTARLSAVLTRYRPVGVLHFAASTEVGVSMTDPGNFYANNVAGTLSLLNTLVAHQVEHFVFSSSCAAYGLPDVVPIPEDHPTRPINPYGYSKLVVENMLEDYERAYGLKSVKLRYFNAVGAAAESGIGERHDPETHVIPLAIQAALGRRPAFKIFGTDYDTRDGTCVRDYIHVLDLADAHVRAMNHMLTGNGSGIFNLGTGTGTTVRELVLAIEAVSGQDFPVIEEARRPGDPPTLVAAAANAAGTLGWSPRWTRMEDIVRSAWTWHTNVEPSLFPTGHNQ